MFTITFPVDSKTEGMASATEEPHEELNYLVSHRPVYKDYV